jgi:hypothetical protein
MTLQENLEKGQQGAKRSSWKKLHFRDLALKVCEQHRDADVEQLATLFLNELEQYPGYMESIAVYIMANVRSSLAPRSGRSGRSGRVIPSSLAGIEQRVVAKTAARVLMKLIMPNGKTLAQSTGAECKRAGGWLVAVGEKIGDRGVVGKKLKEQDLLKLFKSVQRINFGG